ncbi:MAG: hypothetical protein ACM3KR_03345 [Deltaproteobacteria bacterium]
MKPAIKRSTTNKRFSAFNGIKKIIQINHNSQVWIHLITNDFDRNMAS